MPTYRTNGAWGSGIGVNLTPAQVDENFYELRTDLDDVIANPPTANSIESIAAQGFTWTVTLTDGTVLDPLPVPVVYTVWRGDWQPLTLYSEADIFRVVDQGIFAVMQAHTSAATFDPDAAGGSPLAPYYTELIGVASLPADTAIGDLNDVTITSVADGDLLTWDAGSSQWVNMIPADVLTLLAPTLDDLTDVIAPSPVAGQVLRYQGGSPDAGWQSDTLSLDDLDNVSAASPSDGDVLTYQAGSPTGWISASPAAVPNALDDLTDVIAPTPADGDLLQFDGADWVNAPGSAISDLVAATAPFTGSGYMEVSEPAGSPATYTSKKITIDDLFNTRTLAGVTTLPGSGQISANGELSLGSAPAARFSIAGTYNTTNANLASIISTFESSNTGNQVGFSLVPTFNPQGASLNSIVGLSVNSILSGSALNIVSMAMNNAAVTIGAGYSGTITTLSNYNAAGPTISGGTALTVNQFRAAAFTANNNLASGTATHTQFNGAGITSASAGGTVNNRTAAFTVPSGGSSSGTTNNRGVYITGNGGTASGSPPGTVNNFALLSDSTAYSRIEGGLGVGVATRNATTAVSPYFYIPTCAGTPTGVPRNAAVGATAMVFDDTAHKLWVYEQSTSTWKGVVVA